MNIKFKILTLILISKFGLAETITGNWSTQCYKNKTEYQQLKIIFDNQYLKFAKKVYMEDKCKNNHSEYIWMAKYEIFKPKNFKFWNIDFELESVYLRATSKEAQESFNKEKYCGISNWELNQFKNVTGLWCGENRFGDKGFKAYNVLLQEKNKLQVNLEASAPTPVLRPKKPGNIIFTIDN